MNIVFTAILGACDSLKLAPKGADRAVVFTDDPAHLEQPNGWDVQFWPKESWLEADPRREAWRLRCLPHTLFTGFERTIWIDASFTLTNLPRLLRDAAPYDLSALRHHKRSSCYEEGREIVRVGQAPAGLVNPQLQDYRRAGFMPQGLTISCVIVRSNRLPVQTFNVTWNEEIRTYRGDNTQLSVDYAAWKAGLRVHHLTGVRKDNPYAQHDHADHKKRRKPYAEAV